MKRVKVRDGYTVHFDAVPGEPRREPAIGGEVLEISDEFYEGIRGSVEVLKSKKAKGKKTPSKTGG